MNKLVSMFTVVFSFLLLVNCAWCQDPVITEPTPTVVEDPVGFYDKFKEIVDKLSPQVEEIYNFADGDWITGTSIAVANVKSKGIPLVSWRSGYGVNKTAYAGFKLDIPGLVDRYIPENWEVVHFTAKNLGKYAAIGFVGGRNFDDHEWIYGPSIGLEVKNVF